MDKLQPSILQNIASFLTLREQFACFEPLCHSTRDIITDLCRQMKYLVLDDYYKMTDTEFILLMRKCCNVEFLSIDISNNMITCNQDLWEVNIYCPKLQYIVIHGSPLYASEFGDEYVARLAGFNGSIPNVYRDQPTISTYHVFAAARIVFLSKSFNLLMTSIPTYVWCTVKFVLSDDCIPTVLTHLSLDHLVVCAFYAVCRIFGIPMTFQTLLDVYRRYLVPFQSLSCQIKWCIADPIWLNVDLSKIMSVDKMNNLRGLPVMGTMVELYNHFFVPLIYPVIMAYQQKLSLDNQRQMQGIKEEPK